jgi:hypothetical protein
MQPGNSSGPPDWYALLGIAVTASTAEIAAAIERMSRQATALSVTAPERSRQLRDQIRAIKQDLLAGDAQRQRYDAEIAKLAPAPLRYPPPPGIAPGPGYAPPPGIAPGPDYAPPPAGHGTAQRPWGQGAQPVQQQLSGLMSRVARFLQTGWTCKACGYGALPNDKFCQKCGSAIDAPAGQVVSSDPAASPISSPVQPGPANGPSSFCGKCGTPIAPGNTFCTQCGARH